MSIECPLPGRLGPLHRRISWRSGRLVKGLELCEQRRHPFPELYLGEQDRHGPVPVDEEVGALSAGPAVPTLLRPLRLHADAESPTHPVPEARKEAVGGLVLRGHLITGHLLQMLGGEKSFPIQPAAVGEQAGEAVEVGDGGDELAVTHVERWGPGVEATAGRLGYDQSVLTMPVSRG